MKTELVKAHEKVDGKLVFVGEGELTIAESLEDVITMSEGDKPEVTEAQIVSHFNSSRRIEFQRILKSKSTNGKPSAKATVAKLESLAKSNADLAAILRANGFTV